MFKPGDKVTITTNGSMQEVLTGVVTNVSPSKGYEVHFEQVSLEKGILVHKPVFMWVDALDVHQYFDDSINIQ